MNNRNNNQNSSICSGGVGKVYLDRVDGHCYRHESTDHAREKVIPFSLFYLIGVRARYQTNQRRLRRNENLP